MARRGHGHRQDDAGDDRLGRGSGGRSTVAIYSFPRLLNLIRDEIGTENSLLDLLDRLSGVDLLHIDDLGAQHTTPWGLEQLYSIVDARYQAGRPIVATTNLMPDALAEQMGRQILTTVTEDRDGQKSEERREVSNDASEVVGQRIVSRLVEMCGDPLPLFGDDKRRLYQAMRPRRVGPRLSREALTHGPETRRAADRSRAPEADP